MVRTRPIPNPAIDLNAPRSSTAVAKTVNTRKNVSTASSRTARPLVMPAFRWFTEVAPRCEPVQIRSGMARRSSPAPAAAPASWIPI